MSLHTESNILECIFSFFVFVILSYIEMLVMDVKTQKIELDPIFFMTDESFGGSV